LKKRFKAQKESRNQKEITKCINSKAVSTKSLDFTKSKRDLETLMHLNF
jgi:hypothetical protein